MTGKITFARPGPEAMRPPVANAILTASDLRARLDPEGRIVGIPDLPRDLPGVDPALLEGLPATALLQPEDAAEFGRMLASAQGGEISSPVVLRNGGMLPRGTRTRYSILPAEGSGFLLIGRMLERPQAPAMRNATGELKRSDARRRVTEAGYQALFGTIADHVLFVALDSGMIEEANPRALNLLGPHKVIGEPLDAIAVARDAPALSTMLAVARSGQEPSDQRIALAGSGRVVTVSGRAVRVFGHTQLMVHIAPDIRATTAAAGPGLAARLLSQARIPVALCDAWGRLDWTNAAFDDLAATGESLGRLAGSVLGVGETLITQLIADGAQHGRARVTLAHGLPGSHALHPVELTVISVPDTDPPSYALICQLFGQDSHRLPVPAEQMVGRAPLRALLRETVDEIERSCIAAALALTGNNRAAAAEVLGLSRQSLYVKLRRFGMD